jgi:hypothetical protein
MTVAHDAGAAFRTFRRSRSLPAVVVLMLAVAIGAVTAIFSIAHAVLLRPLPVADPDRVVLLWGRDEARSQSVVEVSLADLRAWRDGQKSLSAIEVFGSVNWGELRITAPGEPFAATMNAVSAGFFDLFGTRPILGRTFRREEDLPNAPGTVVLSGVRPACCWCIPPRAAVRWRSALRSARDAGRSFASGSANRYSSPCSPA